MRDVRCKELLVSRFRVMGFVSCFRNDERSFCGWSLLGVCSDVGLSEDDVLVMAGFSSGFFGEERS